MTIRLCADNYFTSQRDFHCIYRRLLSTTESGFHCHEYYEVEIITAGTAKDTINGKDYKLNRGEFLFLAPDNTHYLRNYDAKGTTVVNLAVSIKLMKEIFAFSGITTPSELIWPLTGQLPQEMITQLTEHAQILINPSKDIPEKRILVKQWMTTCFLCSHHFSRKEHETKLPEWMQQLTSELKTPEGLSGGIQYIKTHTTLSYPHICRYFQKYLQQTPVEWINEQRLLYSANLLMHTNTSILEISLECGFNNLSHFNHLFKKFYGITPSVFRSLL